MPYHFTGGVPVKKHLTLQTYYREIDGNPWAIQVVDPTPDGGRVITSQGLEDGRPIKPDNVPTKLLRKGASLKQMPLLDGDSYRGRTLLVSQQFKDMLESLEPDVHQFFPMEIFVGNEKAADRSWLNICNRLDTLHPTLCDSRDERGFFRPKPDGSSREIYSKAAIGNHHAWYDKFSHGQFISDQFAEALMASGMTGMRFQKFDMA